MGVRAEVSMTVSGPLSAEATGGIIRGLNTAAERGLALSLRGVPFDEGTLAGSGTVEPATDVEEGAAIVYDTPYAARLHEHPEFNFSKDSNPSAEGKWLENAIVNGKGELDEIMRAEARRG